jgi:hypothetical protein
MERKTNMETGYADIASVGTIDLHSGRGIGSEMMHAKTQTEVWTNKR